MGQQRAGHGDATDPTGKPKALANRPPRNPRRAYDKDGNELPPSLLRDHKALGCRTVEATCDACTHEAIVDVGDFPDDFPVPDVALRLRCSVCNSKRARVRLNILEYYAAIEAATGWRAP